MKKGAFLIAFLILPLAASRAQTTQPALKLIPTPRQVQLIDGHFTFDKNTTVAVTENRDPEDLFAANQLIDEVRQDLKLPLNFGSVENAKIILRRFIQHGASPHPQSYTLLITPKSIEIAAIDTSGIFYGVQTLKQFIRANCTDNSIPCCKIFDAPVLSYRGWQDDISRGPIPTLDFLKREVRTLSEFKLNVMTLYTEHVFKLKKHPTIAPPDGITADEIKELSEYAKKYHVELIGNFQSFGHFANITKVPGYEKLSDDGWTISPAREESYKFLAEVYSEIAPAYESALFDINCDEVSLNKGATKEMVDRLGLEKVYAMHISRVCELLKPYNKTPMMWGDIAVRHQAIVPQLPKDLIVLSWGYGAREDFNKAIEPFVKTGLRFWVCPGVSCWNRIWPDFQTAEVNISNYVRDGVGHGAMGMLNTTWDDDGENFFSYNWYPLIWGAEVAWNPAVPKEGENADRLREARAKHFSDSFAGCFYGGDDELTFLLHEFANLRENPASGGMSDKAFWRDEPRPGEKPATEAQAKKLKSDAEFVAGRLDQRSPRYNSDSLRFARFAARRVQFIAMRQGGAPADQLAQIAKELKDEYAKLWKQENRPWWLDRNLEKYDQLINRLKAPSTQPSNR
jgi:hexosaminidase